MGRHLYRPASGRHCYGRPGLVHCRDIEPIGRYAIKLAWADGHSTGIFSFEYLRGLCPCPECTAARTA